jgi:hypothetical protein
MTGQAVARANGTSPTVAGTGDSVNAGTGIELSAWLRQQREAIAPGLTDVAEWREEDASRREPRRTLFYGGIGRKP